MARKTKQYPSSKLNQSLVRWRKGVREAIEKRAAKLGHSMNAEINDLVEVGLIYKNAHDSGYKPSGEVSVELVQQLEIFLEDWRTKVAFERLTKDLWTYPDSTKVPK